YVAVAYPGVNSAQTLRRSRVGLLHRRIELCPWRPSIPLVEVVHQCEHLRGWRGDSGGAIDGKVGWLHGYHSKKSHNNNRNYNESLFEHGRTPPGVRVYTDRKSVV